MELVKKFGTFISKPFFHRYSTVFGLWVLLALIAWLTKYFPGKYNNFLIFSESFQHLVQQISLYAEYPSKYFDVFLYGPFFGLAVMPYSITPLWMGLLTWLVSLSVFLYIATQALPFTRRQHLFVYWFCAHELLTALFMSQFNIAIAAIIILSFACIEKEKDFWAAFFILLGTFVKIYGIVGLAFFFFSRHKIKFSISCVFWAIVMFVTPMLFFGVEYIINQYIEWFTVLTGKNDKNLFSLMQNVSFLGMVRKISGSTNYSDLYLILSGLVLFGLPYLRIAQYKFAAFRQTLLASVLLFVVLFSTGSESSSYIIAFMGVAIWYVAAPWKRSKADIALLVFAFILTSMSPSDLFPKYIRIHYVYPYALKALPCMLIWLKLSYEMCRKDYADSKDCRCTSTVKSGTNTDAN